MMTSLPEEETQVHEVNKIVPSNVDESSYIRSLADVSSKAVSIRKRRGAKRSPKRSKFLF